MSDLDLKSLDPVTEKPPVTRILDAASLNAVVKKIWELDKGSALARIDVQKMVDGAPPFDPAMIKDTGQEGRCNLNFGDGKAMLKSEMTGYYDLTDSVPTLAMVLTDYGNPTDPMRAYYNAVISEEFHRLLKDWKAFDTTFQLLIQRFCTHGVGFLYFKDDVDWRWQCAGLDEFKVPRNTTMQEDEIDVATVKRDVTIGKLWSWIKDVEDTDKRWNKAAVRKAILQAADSSLNDSNENWEKWQTMLKNNDLYASTTAQDTVKIAHVWVKEFSGKVSHFITLQNGTNEDFLFKSVNRYECVNECFTFFPYEVGTNGFLHSVRGKAHEIFAAVQVLNSMRCQTVDNARLSGSLLLQPKTETDAQDMAILFYAGAAYIPPGVEVKNGQLDNPSTSILPVIRDMSMLMRNNSGETAAESQVGGGKEADKTKFQVRAELQKESKLPTASMNLFYQPWGRHLTEVLRRVANKQLLKTDPGADEIFALRKRVIDREVPIEALYQAKRLIPVRAIGYGSPSARMLALDEFMTYYGSLDPVGQNNLLRDWFAQRVGYAQVDRYVPPIQENGRAPQDQEIAELQNLSMSAGKPVSVIPNDNHIIHIFAHLPSVDEDLTGLESGQGSPQLLASAQIKTQHIADHMKLLKPDKLNEKIVAELTRMFNNTAERTKAATTHAQREMEKQAQKDAEELAQFRQQPGASPEAAQHAADAEVKRGIMVQDADLKRRLTEAQANQDMAIDDAKAQRELRADSARQRFRNGEAVQPAPTPPIPAPLPEPAAPAVPEGAVPVAPTGQGPIAAPVVPTQ